MKVSLNWIRQFVDIPADLNAEEFGKLFTLRTAEVEGVHDQSEAYANMVIGKIEKITPHPDADKLQVTQTKVGKETVQIVCGATNIKEGMLVPVALPGSKVRWHGEGDLIELKETKIRGVESFGMICAGEEIGLPASPEGIVDLSSSKAEPGTPLSDALNLNDIILDIDNKALTHRPDLWGHYGHAREIAAILDTPLTPFTTDVKYGSGKDLSIEVQAKKECPRYLGVIIEGIEVQDSPEWIQEKLRSTDHSLFNNIVDATNYVLEELGQPLHAFDADKIEGGIVVRMAENGEKLATLDGQDRKLSQEDLVIADHKKAVALAGVMGGENSKVDEKTTRILIEAANFDPTTVRRTSVRHNLRTDAVQRFEKSLDPVLAEQAMDRICEIILELCPNAKIVSQKVDVKNFDETPKTVKVDLNKVRSQIGANIPAEQAEDILLKLGFQILKKDKDSFELQIPTWRATKDVEIEEDITEEIARMFGYENVTPILPKTPTKLPTENTERKLKHRAREILSKGLGMNEVYNYSFYSAKDIQKCMLPEELHIKVENYLSENQTHMRVSLLPNLLHNVALNLKNYPEFYLYEIGRTYEDLQEYFPKEEKKICGLIVRGKKHKGDLFYEAKGAVEELFSFFQTQGLELRKGETLCSYAHPNRFAGYYSKKDGTEVARVFELHPLVAKNYNLEGVKIGVFEVNFTELAKLGERTRKHKPLAKFPSSEFDVSVLMDEEVTIGEMEKQMSSVDKNIIESITLFDLYQGDNIPEGKKSCAFKIVLRAPDRTLKEEEVKKVQEEVFARLHKLGGEIRGLK
ncbi:MAG: phenylalanine--tRNA ligase subunit beta [Candidatus Gracilibacteria bacterium]